MKTIYALRSSIHAKGKLSIDANKNYIYAMEALYIRK